MLFSCTHMATVGVKGSLVCVSDEVNRCTWAKNATSSWSSCGHRTVSTMHVSSGDCTRIGYECRPSLTASVLRPLQRCCPCDLQWLMLLWLHADELLFTYLLFCHHSLVQMYTTELTWPGCESFHIVVLYTDSVIGSSCFSCCRTEFSNDLVDVLLMWRTKQGRQRVTDNCRNVAASMSSVGCGQLVMWSRPEISSCWRSCGMFSAQPCQRNVTITQRVSWWQIWGLNPRLLREPPPCLYNSAPRGLTHSLAYKCMSSWKIQLECLFHTSFLV